MSSRRAPDSVSTPSLDRRPEARAISIEDLLRDVLDGKLRVPAFQRALKWTAKDAENLLDSIYHGYPIGTLLLWQQRGEAETLRYGSVEVPAPAMSDAWWVVDGQQRIHSLARVLAGKGIGQDTFSLYFDLEKARFVRLSRSREVTPNHLPLTEVLDSERLLHWLRSHGATIDEARAIRLGKRLREYQIPVYIVRTEDEDAVREIYRRVNSTGHRMQDDEVFDAIHAARDGQQPKGLRGLSHSLEALGFGFIDGDTLLKMLRALLGRDVFETGAPSLDKDESPGHLAALERSARAVITFLRQDAEIPHRSILPYDLPLIVLTVFFHRFAEIHPRSRELLARWVWRGAITGVHQNNTLNMRSALQAIGDSEHESIQNLLVTTPGTSTAHYHPDTRPFALNWARCRVQVLALLDLGPRHLQTGELISFSTPSQSSSDKLNVNNILNDTLDNWQQDLANRIIHPVPHRGFRDALLKVREAALLRTHAISLEALTRLEHDDFAGFFKLRSEALKNHISAFVNRHTRWDASDRPPLSALEIKDDD